MLRKRWLAGALSDQRFLAAVDDLQDVDLDRYPTLPLMRRASELRSNVTVYDAAYVALAEIMGCDPLTGDRKLVNAHCTRSTVRLLTWHDD